MNTEKSSTRSVLNGLTDEQVSASRQQHGVNLLTPPKKTPMWKLYIEKYKDPIIQILIAAATVSLILACIEGDFIETIGIFLAIFLATTVGFAFERDAAKKFELLNAIGEEQPVKVRRGGKVCEVARKDVVVGDIVLIETGDEVPADGVLVESMSLQIDESSLTGEQLTTKRARSDGEDGDAGSGSKGGDEAYPPYVVLRSSMVMNGHGTMQVTAVGDATEIGKVATKSTEQTDTKTPLSLQLEKLAGLISKLGSAAAIIAFVAFLGHDILTGDVWHTTNYLGMAKHVLGYFMMAVTIIVMAVPEGLPMAVTLALALNMRRMLKSGDLVRKLHASETMGAVTVICTDKTGTLTQNKMTLVDAKFATSDGKATPLHQLAMAINSTAELDGDGNGIGNPTEVALLRWLRENNVDYRALRQQATITSQQPFSTEKKYMQTTAAVAGSSTYTFVKGAPEKVMNFCAMGSDERQAAEQKLREWQGQARRTLAFAVKEASGTADEADRHEGYTFQGIVAISDPIRPDVPDAVKQCQDAGIKVKIVTGDTSATAGEIGREIGIVSSDDLACRTQAASAASRKFITGTEFEALTDEQAAERIKDLCVMSRARPTDKQRLVHLLQQQGEVVAVTGDGTNDAPALNYAHVGLSLGSGTSVAKQASDITLIDDSFGSIAKGVMWGRSLYKNIQRFLFFQLTVNLTACLIVIAGAFVGTEMPLTVTQILWVNLIMDTFAAMALASLPPSHEVMKAKPRKSTDFIVTRPMLGGIVVCTAAFFVALLALLIHFTQSGGIDKHELTIFFTAFVMIQVWNLFNAKCFGSQHSTFRHLVRDQWLLVVVAIIVAGQWLIITFGGEMFSTVPLSPAEWCDIIVATSAVLWAGELWRLIKRLKT